MLRGLVADPSPNIPLLDRLVTGPSAYVRRSVANHLNDISRDHPDTAVELVSVGRYRRGLGRASWPPNARERGDTQALALLGADRRDAVSLTGLTLDRLQVGIGEAVTSTFTLAATEPVDAIVDYRVHYAGARGLKSPKVFKLTRRRLQPGRPQAIRRRHAFQHVSIHRIHPGSHVIDVQVNGQVLGSTAIEVVEELSPARGRRGS